MPKTYTGGCTCGALRYRIDGSPVFENHCQCTDCQKRSGTGHGSYLTFAQRSEAVLTGAATSCRVQADSGNDKMHSFCPVCGAPVYLTFSAMPDLIAIHAGSLDDPGQFNPKVITYSARGHRWDKTDPGLQSFEQMPAG